MNQDPTHGVDAFMARLEHPLKAEIEAVRAIILGSDARIQQSIKWNAPSFSLDDHFATFKLRPAQTVQVVFHTGAKVRPDIIPIHVDAPAGLLTWAAADRCVATFVDMQDIVMKTTVLEEIVQQWIAQL